MKILVGSILLISTLLSACVTNSVAMSGGRAGVATAIPKPGGAFKECLHCPEMVVIPAGSFVMGTAETEPHHRASERQHSVTIAKPFAVSKTEVTWDQWEACVRDNVCNGAAVDAALRLKMDGTPNPDFVDWGAVHGLWSE